MLDRKKQAEILKMLADLYPASSRLDPSDGETRSELHATLFYLKEHGLIEVPTQALMDGRMNFGPSRVTAKGLDFLADDGGLSAILGVVTVKLHDDTIRQLLINRIEAAPGDQSIKESLIAKVKGLPAEALGKLTMDGLDKALAKTPDILSLLGDLLP